MATYPTLLTTVESTVSPIDSRVLARASNGVLKTRLMHATEKLEFRLVHELDLTDRQALDSHYDGDKANSFSYVWPGVGGGTYTVMYVRRPKHVEYGGNRFRSYVELAEV